MIRKHNMQAAESDHEKKARKEKDAIYQRKKMSELSEPELRKIKRHKLEKQRLKRATEKEEKSKLWSEIHRQNNLKPLRNYGLYLKFLCNSDPRTSFYRQALPEVKELSDWKWIINDITDENMTKLELFELSKKFATFFSQAGVEKYSVIHLLSGNNKYALAMLSGILTIGAICSLSDVPSDYETIKYQVSFFRLQ